MMEPNLKKHENKIKKIHYKFSTKGKPEINISWPFIILFITFAISFTINIIASIFTNSLSIFGALLVLISIVLIGIIFDILGTAVVSANAIAFTSMASNKVRGAKEAIILIKNASIFSNIFNDVIGDTCGIISGATLGAIFIRISMESTSSIYYTIASAVIAAFTVGGKAIGKSFAIRYAEKIIYFLARIISYFNYNNYKIFNRNRNKSKIVK